MGLALAGPTAKALASEFDRMFAQSKDVQKPFARFRRGNHPPALDLGNNIALLLGGPGRGRNAFVAQFVHDLETARDVSLAVPYFLPGSRLRRAIERVAIRGGRVRLLLPGVSDVQISRLAARSLYRRLMNAGVEIYEYKINILHAKCYLVDSAAFVGSSNLDVRSLHLNFELMIRLGSEADLQPARDWFEESIQHSQRVDPAAWPGSRNILTKLKERWAFFALAKFDPYFTRWLVQ